MTTPNPENRISQLTRALQRTCSFDAARDNEARPLALRLTLGIRQGDELDVGAVLTDMADRQLTGTVAGMLAQVLSDGMTEIHGDEAATKLLVDQLEAAIKGGNSNE